MNEKDRKMTEKKLISVSLGRTEVQILIKALDITTSVYKRYCQETGRNLPMQEDVERLNGLQRRLKMYTD